MKRFAAIFLVCVLLSGAIACVVPSDASADYENVELAVSPPGSSTGSYYPGEEVTVWIYGEPNENYDLVFDWPGDEDTEDSKTEYNDVTTDSNGVYEFTYTVGVRSGEIDGTTAIRALHEDYLPDNSDDWYYYYLLDSTYITTRLMHINTIKNKDVYDSGDEATIYYDAFYVEDNSLYMDGFDWVAMANYWDPNTWTYERKRLGGGTQKDSSGYITVDTLSDRDLDCNNYVYFYFNYSGERHETYVSTSFSSYDIEGAESGDPDYLYISMYLDGDYTPGSMVTLTASLNMYNFSGYDVDKAGIDIDIDVEEARDGDPVPGHSFDVTTNENGYAYASFMLGDEFLYGRGYRVNASVSHKGFTEYRTDTFYISDKGMGSVNLFVDNTNPKPGDTVHAQAGPIWYDGITPSVTNYVFTLKHSATDERVLVHQASMSPQFSYTIPSDIGDDGTFMLYVDIYLSDGTKLSTMDYFGTGSQGLHISTDQPLWGYEPGDTVTVDLEATGEDMPPEVYYQLSYPDNFGWMDYNILGGEEDLTNGKGSFSFTLPAESDIGHYYLEVWVYTSSGRSSMTSLITINQGYIRLSPGETHYRNAGDEIEIKYQVESKYIHNPTIYYQVLAGSEVVASGEAGKGTNGSFTWTVPGNPELYYDVNFVAMEGGIAVSQMVRFYGWNVDWEIDTGSKYVTDSCRPGDQITITCSLSMVNNADGVAVTYGVPGLGEDVNDLSGTGGTISYVVPETLADGEHPFVLTTVPHGSNMAQDHYGSLRVESSPNPFNYRVAGPLSITHVILIAIIAILVIALVLTKRSRDALVRKDLEDTGDVSGAPYPGGPPAQPTDYQVTQPQSRPIAPPAAPPRYQVPPPPPQYQTPAAAPPPATAPAIVMEQKQQKSPPPPPEQTQSPKRLQCPKCAEIFTPVPVDGYVRCPNCGAKGKA